MISISPTSGLAAIPFAVDGVRVLGLDGSDVTVSLGDEVLDVTWAPDGRSLVARGIESLYHIDGDGSLLGTVAGQVGGVSWEPGGEDLLVVRGDEIRVLDRISLDGQLVERIASLGPFWPWRGTTCIKVEGVGK